MKDPFDKYEKQLRDWVQRCYDNDIDTGDVVNSLKREFEAAKDKLANEEEAAYERQQERLMETGGGPTLQEQQQAAYKIKHGLR